MRWTSWLPFARPRRLCVVGLDIGPETISLAVLMGSTTQADSLCCAERLSLPKSWVVDGEVLQPEALGQWLRDYLAKCDYLADHVYIGIHGAGVSNHLVSLAAGLSQDDVSFQLQAEVQSLLPEDAAEVCIDYTLDSEPAPASAQRYWVHVVLHTQMVALQSVANAAGMKLVVVEPRHEAANRTERKGVLSGLSQAGAALALQHAEAFGLALRAWHDTGINFLPHRLNAQHALRQAWVLGASVSLIGGVFLAAGFALVVSSAAEATHQQMGDVAALTRTFDEVRLTHAQAKALLDRRAEQDRWLALRQVQQSQSLQWGRVLSQAAQGVWVSSVTQQGVHWVVQGEALSSSHAQHLVQQLKALDIWSQSPELPQLQVMPALSSMGLPVWQFRIEADLKEGV